MGIINLDDSARGKWLHNFTKMLEKHTKTLQELSPDSDGRLHSITYDLEKAVGVLTHWQDPQVMLKRAEQLEVKTWYELRMYEEQNAKEIRKDEDKHYISLQGALRRKAKERHLRAEQNLARAQTLAQQIQFTSNPEKGEANG